MLNRFQPRNLKGDITNEALGSTSTLVFFLFLTSLCCRKPKGLYLTMWLIHVVKI